MAGRVTDKPESVCLFLEPVVELRPCHAQQAGSGGKIALCSFHRTSQEILLEFVE